MLSLRLHRDCGGFLVSRLMYYAFAYLCSAIQMNDRRYGLALGGRRVFGSQNDMVNWNYLGLLLLLLDIKIRAEPCSTRRFEFCDAGDSRKLGHKSTNETPSSPAAPRSVELNRKGGLHSVHWYVINFAGLLLSINWSAPNLTSSASLSLSSSLFAK